jgi:hypothetical protein
MPEKVKTEHSFIVDEVPFCLHLIYLLKEVFFKPRFKFQSLAQI